MEEWTDAHAQSEALCPLSAGGHNAGESHTRYCANRSQATQGKPADSVYAKLKTVYWLPSGAVSEGKGGFQAPVRWVCSVCARCIELCPSDFTHFFNKIYPPGSVH